MESIADHTFKLIRFLFLNSRWLQFSSYSRRPSSQWMVRSDATADSRCCCCRRHRRCLSSQSMSQNGIWSNERRHFRSAATLPIERSRESAATLISSGNKMAMKVQFDCSGSWQPHSRWRTWSQSHEECRSPNRGEFVSASRWSMATDVLANLRTLSYEFNASLQLFTNFLSNALKWDSIEIMKHLISDAARQHMKLCMNYWLIWWPHQHIMWPPCTTCHFILTERTVENYIIIATNGAFDFSDKWSRRGED